VCKYSLVERILDRENVSRRQPVVPWLAGVLCVHSAATKRRNASAAGASAFCRSAVADWVEESLTSNQKSSNTPVAELREITHGEEEDQDGQSESEEGKADKGEAGKAEED
jgi:hypothetical protein